MRNIHHKYRNLLIFYCISIFLLLSVILPRNNVFLQTQKPSWDKNVKRAVQIIKADYNNLMEYDFLSPINVTGPLELYNLAKKLNWRGVGVKGYPIIIDGYAIDGTNSKFCISIIDCPLFVSIRNCYFFGVSDVKYEKGFEMEAGIRLVRTKNSEIINSTITSNKRHGIYLKDCNNINVTSCEISKNSVNGINLELCFNSTITSCNIFNNTSGGLSIDGQNIVVKNCSIYSNDYYGITSSGFPIKVIGCKFSQNYNKDILLNSYRGLEIINNTFEKGGGLYVNFGHLNTNEHNFAELNVISGNLIDERLIIYLQEVKRLDIPSNYSQIILVNCSNLILQNLTFLQTGYGLTLTNCRNITINNCNFTQNAGSGILAEFCTNITLFDCIITNNTNNGIILEYTNNIVIYDCIFSINVVISFLIEECSNVSIRNCTIINNLDIGIEIMHSKIILVQESKFNNNQGIGLLIEYNTSYIQVLDNIFIFDGIYIRPNEETYSTADFVNNTINGKPLLFLESKSNIEFITFRDFGQIFLLYCEKITFSKIDFSNVGVPIHIMSCKNIKISECIFYNNYIGILASTYRYRTIIPQNRPLCSNITIERSSFRDSEKAIYFFYNYNSVIRNSKMINCGLFLFDSSDNDITRCNISDNRGDGINLQKECCRNNISYCSIEDCTGYAISIYPTNIQNFITLNNFINNGGEISQSFDAWGRNVFLHNYWSDGNNQDSNKDGFADEPYLISSFENRYNSYDQYPLVSDQFIYLNHNYFNDHPEMYLNPDYLKKRSLIDILMDPLTRFLLLIVVIAVLIIVIRRSSK